MRRDPLKLLAFTSAVALGFAVTNNVVAQTQTVVAQLTTSSAITTTDVSDMDFGTWLVQNTAPDTPTLTMTPSGAFSVTAAGAPNSQVVQVTAGVQRGVVNVQTPAASVLQMTRSNEVAFTDAALSLGAVTYNTVTEGDTALGVAATVTVTVTTAATDEPVNFGAVLNIGVGSADPADAAHTASFDVTFAY